jgi:phosphatidate phosphatase PAH1
MAPQPKASADSPSDLLGVIKMGVWKLDKSSASTQYNSLTDIYFPPVQSQTSTSIHSTTDQSRSVFPRMKAYAK